MTELLNEGKTNDIGYEFDTILREAAQSVEQQLALEDRGWLTLGGSQAYLNGLTDAERILSVQKARVYAVKDPLAKQSIRLWTDYGFGTGMTWTTKDEKTEKVLKAFWNSPDNKNLLSASGQRMSSDKLKIDGEIFFALFLQPKGKVIIRRINPLEITDVVTNPDDAEDVRYYKREWNNKTAYYRSYRNKEDKGVGDIKASRGADALIYHLPINTIGQRGNSELLAVLDWIKLYRQFLASRVALMLALSKFAWITKVKGGQAQVDAIKAVTQDKDIHAGSHMAENMGSDTKPIKTDSGARNAYEDGRQIKLAIFAGVGWPEQYYADISTGNLATAKTVELPVMKMIESYQAIWTDAYDEIDAVVLRHNNIDPNSEGRYVDRDFPSITPSDQSEMANNITAIMAPFPEFKMSRDVVQQALLSIGIKDPNPVIDSVMGAEGSQESTNIMLLRALKGIKEAMKGDK